ncbi:hypothetical protein IFR04_002829 [Cadophora malorum]|uniref:Helicase C-terminal domain-containing protein n=1 Tax=Cadophora malorum TaxID=108018 RepID=A0A8H7WFT7_9HELO|nr:hypothetical protein IFR04_002829 [Cadophora malorum]
MEDGISELRSQDVDFGPRVLVVVRVRALVSQLLSKADPIVIIVLLLHLTSRAVGSYITGEDANENNSGAYLRKIWSKILIRRTYASPDPKDPTKFIGDSVASLTTRRLTCRFTRSEEALYRDLSENAYKNLITVLPDGSRVWNRKYSRELILNSTWLGWAYIGDKFTASTIKEWKEKDDLLWQMIRLLYNTMTKNDKEPGFDMPKRDDIPAQLAIICRGAPKIRATIRLLSELVLLKERKLVLWSSLPANQILLHAILQAVGIKNVCYSSEMNMQERDAAKQAFNKDPDCMVFDGSYYVGSFGLNLQFGCNHTAEFDGAPNIGLRNQARGRTRRVGQGFGVENYEITNVNSFQNRVVLNTLYKAVPGAMAELSVNIKNKSKAEGDELPEVEDDFEEKELKIDSPGWYLINDELIQAPDPRLDGIAYKSPLTPYAFVRVILELARGKINNADPDWTEEDVDLNVLDDPALDNFDFEI